MNQAQRQLMGQVPPVVANQYQLAGQTPATKSAVPTSPPTQNFWANNPIMQAIASLHNSLTSPSNPIMQAIANVQKGLQSAI